MSLFFICGVGNKRRYLMMIAFRVLSFKVESKLSYVTLPLFAG